MFRYNAQLALHGLRRFPRTMALAVLTVAIGLAASMTTLALLHMLSADPLPGLSQHLYLAWADTVQAKPQDYNGIDNIKPVDYKRIKMPDAEALMVDHRATRQTVVADLSVHVEDDQGRHSDNPYLLAILLGYSSPRINFYNNS